MGQYRELVIGMQHYREHVIRMRQGMCHRDGIGNMSWGWDRERVKRMGHYRERDIGMQHY
jgi:hypothetical protein